MKSVLSLFFLLFATWGFTQTQDGYVSVDDFQLYYKIYGGKGKPVLLINGGPGFSSNYLDELAAEMSKDMKSKIILFDPRGTGKSIVDPINSRTVNLRNQVKDIEKLRQHLDIDSWDVIGHAYGGAIAMMYAKNNEKHINKLVLSSAIGMDLSFVEPMQANLKARLSGIQNEDLQTIAEEREKGILSKSKYFKKRFDLLAEVYVYFKENIQTARDIIQLETDFNLDINLLLWDELNHIKYNVKKEMASFKKPVLILHGRQDVIGESVPIESHAVFPNSQLVFLNEAGRYLWIDQPDSYFNILEEFLN